MKRFYKVWVTTLMAVFAVSLLWRYDLDVDAKYLLLHVVISFWVAALIEVLCALAGVIKRKLGRRKGE
jgi:hypothetical protein